MMKFWGWGDPHKEYDLAHRPLLWDFVQAQLGLENRVDVAPLRPEQITVPEARIHPDFQRIVTARLGGEQVSNDPQVRLHHAYGKSYRDLLRARSGKVDRVPDLVLFPRDRAEVETILKAAGACGVQLVPFGGGTNISGGVEPDPTRTGMAATVSLRRMNRVLAVDPIARTARIEAGALGPELEATLNAQGFTLGHFPDSFEFRPSEAGWRHDPRGCNPMPMAKSKTWSSR